MSALQKLGTYQIPDYALPYLINGDSSALSEEDEKTINDWIAKEFPDHENLTYEYDTEEGEFFTWYPAFGLASTAMDVTIHGHKRKPVHSPAPGKLYDDEPTF